MASQDSGSRRILGFAKLKKENEINLPKKSLNLSVPSNLKQPERSPEEWHGELQRLAKLGLPKSELIENYKRVIKILDFTKYPDSSALVDIWLQFILLQQSNGCSPEVARRFYQRMQEIQLGSKLASFYIAWSQFEEGCDEWDKALEVLRKGLAAGASPMSILSDKISRLSNRTSTLAIPQSVLAPSSGSTPAIKPARVSRRLGTLGPVRRSIDGSDDEDGGNTTMSKTSNTSTISPASSNASSSLTSTITPLQSQLHQQQQQQIQSKEEYRPSNNTVTMDIVVSPQRSAREMSPILTPASSNSIPAQVDSSMESDSRSPARMRSHFPEHPSATQQELKQPKSSTSTSRMVVNGKPYLKLDLLGKGGSSKVFKAMCPSTFCLFALKRVNLRGVDKVTLSGYENEIELLNKMKGSERIIQLYDWEINRNHGYLHMIMECGEIDLAHVLQKQPTDVNLNFVRVYWEQMLQAVHAIHEERVVHSDLKPANFLFVKGALKLIDFGIAKAIQNDTTNIHREHQVGTVNYMSPEAIMDTNSMQEPNKDGTRTQCMKLSRASDVWSLGCILYQMTYGHTPFSHLQMIPKLQKIIDPNYPIEYPALPEHMNNPFLLQQIKGCLVRDPKERVTIPQLLEHPFLKPDRAMRQLQDFSLNRINFIVTETLKLSKNNNDMSPDDMSKLIYQAVLKKR